MWPNQMLPLLFGPFGPSKQMIKKKLEGQLFSKDLSASLLAITAGVRKAPKVQYKSASWLRTASAFHKIMRELWARPQNIRRFSLVGLGCH